MSEETPQPHPVTEVARLVKEEEEEAVIKLATGDLAKLHPVSAALIGEVTSRVKDPKPPVWHNAEHDRDEPNYSDPDYLEALAAAETARGVAVMDALCMFGVELLAPVEANADWIKKLKYLEKRGALDLSSFDLADEMDREFLYKRFVAVDNDVIAKVGALSGVTQEGVAKAERSFQRDKKR